MREITVFCPTIGVGGVEKFVSNLKLSCQKKN